MKKCELCSSQANMYCESDQASLCWRCDTKVHSANFLVAKHSRTILCNVCHVLTPWKGSGEKLGPTMLVCQRCVEVQQQINRGGKGIGGGEEEIDGGNDADVDDDDDEESGSSDEDNEEYDEMFGDEDDDQVVPLTSSASCTTPPPPVSSSSGSEDDSSSSSSSSTSTSTSRRRTSSTLAAVSLKRKRDKNADLCSHHQEDQYYGCCSSTKPANFNTTARLTSFDYDDEATSFGSFRRSTSKEQKRDLTVRSSSSDNYGSRSRAMMKRFQQEGGDKDTSAMTLRNVSEEKEISDPLISPLLCLIRANQSIFL